MFCEHVYKNPDSDPCSKCGKPSHKVDWELIHSLHKKWWADGNADWSICKDCGGGLRGWWSI